MSSYPPPSNRGSPVYNPVDYNVPNFGAGTAGADVATQGGNNNFTGTNTFLGITSSGINSISGYASLNGSNTYSNASINTFQTSSLTGNLPVYFQQDTSLSTTQLGQDETSNNLDILNSVVGSGIYFSDSSNNFTLTANSAGQAVFSGGVSGAVSLSDDNTFTGTNTFSQTIVGNISGSASSATTANSATTATSAFTATTAGSAAVATNIAGGTTNQVPYQTGVGTTSFTTGGSQGQVLTYNTASAPTWTTISSGGGGNVSTNTSNTYSVGTTQTYQTTSTNFGAPVKFQNNTYNTNSQLLLDSANTGNFLIVNNTTGSGIYFGDPSGNFTITTNSSNQIVSANDFKGNVIGSATNLNITGSTAGSIPYQTAQSTTTALSAGQVGQVLVSNATTLKWSYSGATFTYQASTTSNINWTWTNPLANFPFIQNSAFTAFNCIYCVYFDKSQYAIYAMPTGNTSTTQLYAQASSGGVANFSVQGSMMPYSYYSPPTTQYQGIALIPSAPTTILGFIGTPTFQAQAGTNFQPNYYFALPTALNNTNTNQVYLSITILSS